MDKKRITIIGSGFSGLTAAYYLSRAGFAVEVHESSDRSGGLLQTRQLPWGLVEPAANGALNSIRFQEMCDHLGVPLQGTLKASRRRYIYREGQFRRWPLKPVESIKLGRLLVTYLTQRSSLRPLPQESVRMWGIRVASEPICQYLIEAALQGIYAGDPRQLSASTIFGPLFRSRKSSHFVDKAASESANDSTEGLADESTEDSAYKSTGLLAGKLAEKLKGSRSASSSPRARLRFHGTVAPVGGMSELVHRLESYLREQDVHFHYGTKNHLNQTADSVAGRNLSHPHIIATSASAAADVLMDYDPVRAHALQSVQMLPLVAVTAFFNPDPKALYGFGCLFPPCENRLALGFLVNTSIFPHRSFGHRSEKWILGGAFSDYLFKNPGLIEMSDEELIDVIVHERQQLMGLSDRPVGYDISRWSGALPHYTTKHEEILPLLQRYQGNVVLHGNYLGGIGLSKILERTASLPDLIFREGQWS